MGWGFRGTGSMWFSDYVGRHREKGDPTSDLEGVG